MVWQGLAEAVFPARCPGCGRAAEPICDACLGSLRPSPAGAPPAGVDGWAAAFAYEGVARELVARVKYRQAHAAVPWLAAEMVRALDFSEPVEQLAVTWVPTTAARRRARGFDHAEQLARAVARALGLRVRRALWRRHGPPQTGLPVSARRRGPAFTAVPPVPKRVLLVDDVVTTGATLRSAAAALRSGGAELVAALTAARTPRR